MPLRSLLASAARQTFERAFHESEGRDHLGELLDERSLVCRGPPRMWPRRWPAHLPLLRPRPPSAFLPRRPVLEPCRPASNSSSISAAAAHVRRAGPSAAEVEEDSPTKRTARDELVDGKAARAGEGGRTGEGKGKGGEAKVEWVASSDGIIRSVGGSSDASVAVKVAKSAPPPLPLSRHREVMTVVMVGRRDEGEEAQPAQTAFEPDPAHHRRDDPGPAPPLLECREGKTDGEGG